MDNLAIRELLENIKNERVSVDDAMDKLRDLPFEDLGYAKIDNHRSLRNGYPEVIYCQGKQTEHIVGIVENMMKHDNNILATKANKEVYEAVKKIVPEAVFHEICNIIFIEKKPLEKSEHKILIATGGTSDIAVAEEAAITAEVLGNTVVRLYDVGVAGIHRLLANRKMLEEASVVIAVAGMEGALASVVGGLVDVPVIAVPTSIGYGASFGGVAALLAMLNSCASGIGVVNIDNGFGAGYLASTMNRQLEIERKKK